MGFSRQKHWSGLPCPSPGNLLDPGWTWVSHIAGRFFTIWAIREALCIIKSASINKCCVIWLYSCLDLPTNHLLHVWYIRIIYCVSVLRWLPSFSFWEMAETWPMSHHCLMPELDWKSDFFEGWVSIPSTCKDYYATVNVLWLLFCVLQIESKRGFIKV